MQAGGSSAAAQGQFSIYPIPSVSAICTFSATEPVWDAATIFPGLSSDAVCQHEVIQGCGLSQWLTSYSLGTVDAGSVKSNC